MSTIDIREVRAEEEWNQALLALPHPHILQSYQWGQVKQITGWSPRYLLLTEGGRLGAAALVLRRKLSFAPVSVLYVPKGPLLADEADAALLEQVLAALEAEARRQRAILVKIDPDLPDGRAPADLLQRRRWRRGEAIQFRNTAVVDLAADEEALLARMKAKTRYNIRLAERRGVQVRAGSPADLPAFYTLYKETGARDGFLTRPFTYYEQVWTPLLNAGLGRLFLAEHERDLLGGVLALRFGPTAWYMYGASSNEKREHMPNYLLQWETMRWAKSCGCTSYDMWGAPDRMVESDPLWGVYRFKEGLGAQFVPHVGAYDFVARPALYLLYTWALPRALALLRKVRGEPTLGQAGPG